MIRNLDAVGNNLFRQHSFVIYENDSSSQYLEQLHNYFRSRNISYKLVSEKLNLQKRPSISFLGYCRNKYLEELRNVRYSDTDYVIVADLDLRGVSLSGVRSSLLQNGWSAMTSNGIYSKGKYYDKFALRCSSFPLEPLSKQWDEANICFTGNRLIEVDSAFGGMAIYRYKEIIQCYYDQSSDDCEHVALNQQLRRFGKICINPRQYAFYNRYEKMPEILVRLIIWLRKRYLGKSVIKI